jgi:hypothetical protein
LVQGIDGCHLLTGEFEVEQGDVVADARGVGRLRDDDPVLEVPPQNDLGDRALVRVGDLRKRGVLERFTGVAEW